MAGEIEFYQILYHESQRSELYPFATPYFSVGLTPYFENAIIAGLVPMSTADYVSVASWRLRQKRGDAAHYLGGYGKDILTVEKIQSAMPFDVAVLTPHSPAHQPLAMAAHWHGRAWVEAFEALKPFIKEKIGRVPSELNNAIYENHFIAKREIYQAYVTDFLIPAINFIGFKPVFYQDSGYEKKKRDNEEKVRIKNLTGRSDWPILPFVLERLFSIYINDKNLNVIKI